MSNPRCTESITIARSATDLYNMVSNITRMGEWSPICKTCWWDEGAGPHVGAWFTGRNESPDRTWETRSQVVLADAGRAFAFRVDGTYVEWGYTFASSDEGTEVTESWELLPAIIERWRERFGAELPERIAARTEEARKSMAETLSALKIVAEAGLSERGIRP